MNPRSRGGGQRRPGPAGYPPGAGARGGAPDVRLVRGSHPGTGAPAPEGGGLETDGPGRGPISPPAPAGTHPRPASPGRGSAGTKPLRPVPTATAGPLRPPHDVSQSPPSNGSFVRHVTFRPARPRREAGGSTSRRQRWGVRTHRRPAGEEDPARHPTRTRRARALRPSGFINRSEREPLFFSQLCFSRARRRRGEAARPVRRPSGAALPFTGAPVSGGL